MTEYESGRQDGVLYCVDMLRAIAVESKNEFAAAFREIADAWERDEIAQTGRDPRSTILSQRS